MRKYTWIVVLALIVGTITFVSCKRMEEMAAPVIPDPEPVEEMTTPEPVEETMEPKPPEMVEAPEPTETPEVVEPEPEVTEPDPLMVGLVLHLSFDADTIQGNTVTDQSVEGNDGIINGAAQIVPGKYGEAMAFDGTDDFVEVPLTSSITFSTGDSFTAQVWVKTDDAPQLDDAIVGNYRQPTDKFWDFAHLGDNPEWRGRMSFNLQSGTDPQSGEPIFTAVGHQTPPE